MLNLMVYYRARASDPTAKSEEGLHAGESGRTVPSGIPPEGLIFVTP